MLTLTQIEERRAAFRKELERALTDPGNQVPHPFPWTCCMVIHDGPGAQFIDANGKPVLGPDLIREPSDAATLLFSINALCAERDSLQTLVEAQTQSIRLTSDALLKENQRANAAEAERDKWKTACKAWEGNSLELNGEHAAGIEQARREYAAMKEDRDSLAAQLAKAVEVLEAIATEDFGSCGMQAARILSSLKPDTTAG